MIELIPIILLGIGIGIGTPRDRAEEMGLTLVAAPALRSPHKPGLLGDVYAHNDKVENWKSPTTLAHEGTHGANSIIRNRYGGWAKVNAMYFGNNLSVVLNEPHVKMSRMAIPKSMQGSSYNLYFKSAQVKRDWDNYTLYVFDEWSSYINAARVGQEIGNPNFSDSLQAIEFTVYVLHALQATMAINPDYDATQMRLAVAWVIESYVLPILQHPSAHRARTHWKRFQTFGDAADLRLFCQKCFGTPWSKEVLGIQEAFYEDNRRN